MDKLDNFAMLIAKTAIEAGKLEMEIYAKDFGIEYKQDQSPVTEADKLAAELINSRLANTATPIVNEESPLADYSFRKSFTQYWLVDPLDGTKEFIKKNGEFTVNIALIEDGLPIMGVVYLPAKDVIYIGAKNVGSFSLENAMKFDFTTLESFTKAASKLPIKHERKTPRIVASRSHRDDNTENYIAELQKVHPEVEIVAAGSSLKFCLIAEGSAEYYPRFGPTMEWDTGAGHAIAKFAGKSVIDMKTKNELRYNKEVLLNNHFIVS